MDGAARLPDVVSVKESGFTGGERGAGRVSAGVPPLFVPHGRGHTYLATGWLLLPVEPEENGLLRVVALHLHHNVVFAGFLFGAARSTADLSVLFTFCIQLSSHCYQGFGIFIFFFWT